MTIKELLTLVGQPGRTNIFVTCPDELGLSFLLQGALGPIASTEDIYFYDAEQVTKEKARQIEREVRLAPRGGSELSHCFIHRLQRLPYESVGPLLKAVEEAKFARFIFQAQSAPSKILTLKSRATTIRLPFLSKKLVLGNMQAMNYDARTADEMGLYDGTLGGTVKALGMKDTVVSIRRELTRGMRGLAGAYHPEVLGSLAFDAATSPFLDDEEKDFLDQQRTPERQKLVLFRALRRVKS